MAALMLILLGGMLCLRIPAFWLLVSWLPPAVIREGASAAGLGSPMVVAPLPSSVVWLSGIAGAAKEDATFSAGNFLQSSRHEVWHGLVPRRSLHQLAFTMQ